MADISTELIKRYLQDAIAAEKGFEIQLNGFGKDSDDEAAKAVFQKHVSETRGHVERLTRRVEQLGGNASTAKSLLSQIFNLAPRSAHFGHDEEDRGSQNLILAFAIENNQLAMYESLASTATAAGDPETAELVRGIQAEEKMAADAFWSLLSGKTARPAAGLM